MSIRHLAVPWLRTKNVSSKEAIYTSKFYRPEESWPKVSVWWFVIPQKQIESNKTIHLICQSSPESGRFYYLKVPSMFMKEHLNKFDRVHESLHIYLSTDPINMFTEIRGKGRLPFGQFLISDN